MYICIFIYIHVLSFALRRVLVSWSCMKQKQAMRRVSFRSLPVYVSLLSSSSLRLSLFICTGSNRQTDRWTDGLELINCGASLPAASAPLSLSLSSSIISQLSHSVSLFLSLPFSHSPSHLCQK